MSIDIIKTALAQVGRFPEGGIVPNCDPNLRPGESPVNFAPDGTPLGPCDFPELLNLASNIVNTLIALAFLAVVFFIIVGGFRLLLSEVNPERLKAARAN
ncbi:MAG: hypothetical protein U1C52_00245, partial [Patescibacteria group bacterium]|nr:hypothetical protein [Patescibacteria group bacterium]